MASTASTSFGDVGSEDFVLAEMADELLETSACSSAMYVLEMDDEATENLAREARKESASEGCCTPTARGSSARAMEDEHLGSIVYRASPAFVALSARMDAVEVCYPKGDRRELYPLGRDRTFELEYPLKDGLPRISDRSLELDPFFAFRLSGMFPAVAPGQERRAWSVMVNVMDHENFKLWLVVLKLLEERGPAVVGGFGELTRERRKEQVDALKKTLETQTSREFRLLKERDAIRAFGLRKFLDLWQGKQKRAAYWTWRKHFTDKRRQRVNAKRALKRLYFCSMSRAYTAWKGEVDHRAWGRDRARRVLVLLAGKMGQNVRSWFMQWRDSAALLREERESDLYAKAFEGERKRIEQRLNDGEVVDPLTPQLTPRESGRAAALRLELEAVLEKQQLLVDSHRRAQESLKVHMARGFLRQLRKRQLHLAWNDLHGRVRSVRVARRAAEKMRNLHRGRAFAAWKVRTRETAQKMASAERLLFTIGKGVDSVLMRSVLVDWMLYTKAAVMERLRVAALNEFETEKERLIAEAKMAREALAMQEAARTALEAELKAELSKVSEKDALIQGMDTLMAEAYISEKEAQARIDEVDRKLREHLLRECVKRMRLVKLRRGFRFLLDETRNAMRSRRVVENCVARMQHSGMSRAFQAWVHRTRETARKMAAAERLVFTIGKGVDTVLMRSVIVDWMLCAKASKAEQARQAELSEFERAKESLLGDRSVAIAEAEARAARILELETQLSELEQARDQSEDRSALMSQLSVLEMEAQAQVAQVEDRLREHLLAECLKRMRLVNLRRAFRFLVEETRSLYRTRRVVQNCISRMQHATASRALQAWAHRARETARKMAAAERLVLSMGKGLDTVLMRSVFVDWMLFAKSEKAEQTRVAQLSEFEQGREKLEAERAAIIEDFERQAAKIHLLEVQLSEADRQSSEQEIEAAQNLRAQMASQVAQLEEQLREHLLRECVKRMRLVKLRRGFRFLLDETRNAMRSRRVVENCVARMQHSGMSRAFQAWVHRTRETARKMAAAERLVFTIGKGVDTVLMRSVIVDWMLCAKASKAEQARQAELSEFEKERAALLAESSQAAEALRVHADELAAMQADLAERQRSLHEDQLLSKTEASALVGNEKLAVKVHAAKLFVMKARGEKLRLAYNELAFAARRRARNRRIVGHRFAKLSMGLMLTCFRAWSDLHDSILSHRRHRVAVMKHTVRRWSDRRRFKALEALRTHAKSLRVGRRAILKLLHRRLCGAWNAWVSVMAERKAVAETESRLAPLHQSELKEAVQTTEEGWRVRCEKETQRANAAEQSFNASKLALEESLEGQIEVAVKAVEDEWRSRHEFALQRAQNAEAAVEGMGLSAKPSVSKSSQTLEDYGLATPSERRQGRGAEVTGSPALGSARSEHRFHSNPVEFTEMPAFTVGSRRLRDDGSPASELISGTPGGSIPAWRDRLNDTEKQLYMRLKYREAVSTGTTASLAAPWEASADAFTPLADLAPGTGSAAARRAHSVSSARPHVTRVPLSPRTPGSTSSFMTARSHFDPMSAQGTTPAATAAMMSPAGSTSSAYRQGGVTPMAARRTLSTSGSPRRFDL